MTTRDTATPCLFLFSGQGSQYYHMCASLMARDAPFQQAMRQLDEVACRLLGGSVIERIFDPRRQRSEPFTDSLYTHPAIFMVEYALTCSLRERGITPAGVLGSSLGEYMASVCAGVMTPQAAFELVVRQAQLIDAVCPPGGMMAVLHDPALYEQTPFIQRRAELVSSNFDQHFVISGPLPALREIDQFLAERDILRQLLPVSRAFHSAAMEPAAVRFRLLLQDLQLSQPMLPVYSSVTGRRQLHFDTEYFWRLGRGPILFRDALLAAERDGPWLYVDVGPSGTMATLARNMLGAHNRGELFPLLSPYADLDRGLQRLQARCAVGGASPTRSGTDQPAYELPMEH